MNGKLVPFRRLEGRVEEMSDEALLAAAGVGDSAALGALFDRFHRIVYRYLSRLQGGRRGDLDDLVQATFLTVQNAARRYSGRGSVSSFILGVATNVSRHHVRGESRRRAMLSVFASATSNAPLGPTPGDTVERRELLARVEHALQDLPHDLRVVFVLTELEEIPGTEVARMLNLRPGTVWRRLHEARKSLRRAIDGGEG
jgi:RNA polymerase sigma-70 factor (ECF subfamily)